MSTRKDDPKKRSQAVADDAARLLAEAVVKFTEEALNKRLDPFADQAKSAVTQARGTVDKATEACDRLDTAIKELRNVPIALDSRLGTLFQTTAATSVTELRAELEPILAGVKDAADRTLESADAAEGASQRLAEALVALANGPLPLVSYLERAEANLDAFSLRVSDLEQAVRRMTHRILLWLSALGLVLVGVIAWAL